MAGKLRETSLPFANPGHHEGNKCWEGDYIFCKVDRVKVTQTEIQRLHKGLAIMITFCDV